MPDNSKRIKICECACHWQITDTLVICNCVHNDKITIPTREEALFIMKASTAYIVE